MNLPAFAVRRPVTTCVVYLIIVLFGVLSLARLPIDLLPDLTFPTMNIRVSYAGVGPEELERLVTIPLEEAISTVPGIEEITSTSSEGSSQVRVSFTWGTNLDAAMNDLRAALDRMRDRLPTDADDPAIFRFDPSQTPILFYGIEARMPTRQLRVLAETTLKNRLSRVDGVGAVEVQGGELREFQVHLDAQKLIALDMSLERISTALADRNRNVPAGSIEHGLEDVLFRSQGEFKTLDDIRYTVVDMRDDAPIYVGDLGEVTDGVKEEKRLVRINGRSAVMLRVTKRSGANTSDVARAVRDEVEALHADLPDIRLVAIMDQSKFIEQAISNVQTSALVGAVFAVAILFIFLKDLLATLIVALTIPISVIATFILMYSAGYTLNLISFGGLALGIGMLVDTAIVILENVFRHREQGADPKEAAIRGASEVSAAVTASTLTTISVFLPLLFIEGVAGVLFHQMAMVVTFALTCSLFVALTLTPLLGSWLPETPDRRPDGRRPRYEVAYGKVLQVALKRPYTVIGCATIIFGVSVGMLPLLGREFLPAADEGDIRMNLQTAVGTRLGILDEAEKEVEKIVERDVPEMESRFASLGGSLFGGRAGLTHEGQFRIKLVPRAERARSDREVAAALGEALGDIPGVTITARTVSGLFVFRRLAGGGSGVSVEVRGHDAEASMYVAETVLALMSETEGLQSPEISRKVGRPEVTIHVDPEKAALYDLTTHQVARALEDHLSGRVATRIRQGGLEHDVRVRLRPEDRDEPDDLLHIPVPGPGGRMTPLGTLLSFSRVSGPIELERRDQERIITISADVYGRPINRIVEELEPKLRAIPLPPGLSVAFSGDVREQEEAFLQLAGGLALAILLVYLVMAAQFENLLSPLVIMFSVPFALIGVIGILLPTGTTLNVQSFLGLIVLAGVVVNNAIVLVDFVGQLRHDRGLPTREAILIAGRARLRPILMTTLTTVLALIPIAIGAGEGGEVQASMGRVVVGGLITSTLITLILIPVLYDLVFGRAERQRDA